MFKVLINELLDALVCTEAEGGSCTTSVCKYSLDDILIV